MAAGEEGRARRAQQGSAQRHEEQGQAEGVGHAGDVVEHLIGRPDDQREQCAAAEVAQQAACQRRAARVEQVLGQDRTAAVAQRPERADLGALVVDHAGHGGGAHQRGDEEEEHREHGGQPLHDLGVALKAGIAGVGGAVEDVQLRRFQVGQLLTGVGQVGLRVGGLAVQFRHAVLILFNAVVVFLPAILQRPAAVLIGGEAGFVLIDTALELVEGFFGGVQLGALGGVLTVQLRLSGGELGATVVDLLFCRVQLGLGVCQLVGLGVQLDALGVQLAGALVQLCAVLVEGGFLGLQRRPGVLQLFQPRGGVLRGQGGADGVILRPRLFVAVPAVLPVGKLCLVVGSGRVQLILAGLPLGVVLGEGFHTLFITC